MYRQNSHDGIAPDVNKLPAKIQDLLASLDCYGYSVSGSISRRFSAVFLDVKITPYSSGLMSGFNGMTVKEIIQGGGFFWLDIVDNSLLAQYCFRQKL